MTQVKRLDLATAGTPALGLPLAFSPQATRPLR